MHATSSLGSQNHLNSTRHITEAFRPIPARPLNPNAHQHCSSGRKCRRDRITLKGFGDDLLDYITAGPKLRKWYGEGERMPVDGGGDVMADEPDTSELEEDGVRDAILVTDADSPTAEQIVLQLILSRAKVKALVKNAAAASTAYGSYVTPVEGNSGDVRAVQAALRGVRAVICTGRLGEVLPLLQQRNVQHLILLTSTGAAGGGGFSLGAFLDGEAAAQRDAARTAAALRSGVPCTVVRIGQIADGPGGSARLIISQEGSSGRPLGQISREDVARVLVQCLDRQPSGSLTFLLEAGGPSVPSEQADLDLAEQLARLQESMPAANVL